MFRRNRTSFAATHALLLVGLAALWGCGDGEELSTANGSSTSSSSAGSGGAGGNGGGAAGGSGGQGGFGGMAQLPQKRFLYVANRDSNSIQIFNIDEAGALTANGEVTVSSPAPLAVDPARNFLYAGSLQPKTVSAYAIDHASGALTPAGTSVLEVRPVYLAVDNDGGTLLLASYGDNVANSYALNVDGTVVEGAVISFVTGTNPHSIIAHPSLPYVFVPNTNSDAITQFTFEPSTHTLTLNSPAALATENGAGPRHMVFHPNGEWLYAVNEHADSVSRFVMAANGTLSPAETLTTLPAQADGGSNTCADIHVTPDGKYLYASNRGHDSIAMFSIGVDGALTALGHQPTEPVPREFEVTPDGRFLYVAGQQSGKLAAYAIETTGMLTPLTSYSVGQAPLWVLAISVDDPAELQE